jgi:hypothetical protein
MPPAARHATSGPRWQQQQRNWRGDVHAATDRDLIDGRNMTWL